MPFIMSFILSFTNFNILSPDTKFVGLDNYVKLFTQDKLFLKSLFFTFKFAFISVPLRLIFALFVAMILMEKQGSSSLPGSLLPSIYNGRGVSSSICDVEKPVYKIRSCINRPSRQWVLIVR